jgi:hypothetical protein
MCDSHVALGIRGLVCVLPECDKVKVGVPSDFSDKVVIPQPDALHRRIREVV